jgi:non-specific serine/threonine protein kinase
MGERQFATVVQSERAHAERRLGNTAQAAALYSQSILNWQAIGNSGAVAHELECFAFIAIAHSQARRAARLLGAAEALRASLGSTMTWQEQAEYDHHLATLRAQMDEAALAKGWAAGQALTMEQAIAFALEEPTGSTTSHPASGSASTQSA